MVLNGEEKLGCEVHVDGIRLEHVSEFKYLECVLNETRTGGTECSEKLASGRLQVVMGRLIGIGNRKNRCFLENWNLGIFFNEIYDS